MPRALAHSAKIMRIAFVAMTVAVSNDGTHYVLVAAPWSLGIWRYIEP